MISWDIETEGLPREELEAMMPEFDPDSVKLGNLKDEAKINLKINNARISHINNFISKAALSAVTGRVLAIGYYSSDKDQSFIDGIQMRGDQNLEAGIITRFWHKAESCRDTNVVMVGLNTHDFDLPFLVRRSWILDVEIPDWIITSDRYFHSIFVDLRKKWLCGQQATHVRSSFDELGRAFGSGGKTEGVTGADFAKLWWNDREKAVEYLTNDVKQPVLWAQQMGIF